jgi:RNA polymerase sigma-70 factor (ECF subfamily)
MADLRLAARPRIAGEFERLAELSGPPGRHDDMDHQALPMAFDCRSWSASNAEMPKMRTAVSLDPERPGARALTSATAADPRVVADVEARHGQALLGFVRRLGLSDSEAADAVQEVLLRLWIELRGGTQIENPQGWAYRSIYRLAMDQHRLSRRIAALRALLGSPGREPLVREASDRIAVWTEVDRLPERQRQVVYLRYRSGLAFEEIGHVVGISSSAARSHSTQAMATLRSRLTPEGGD